MVPASEDALYDRLLSLIAECAGSTESFEQKSRRVDDFISGLERKALAKLIGESGFIPETYAHDSSDEKLYAKAMDCLIAAALRHVGYDAQPTAERSDAADVLATKKRHGVVLDAKAFRLSRTALNPKDYKIEALSGWRTTNEFAALVAPLAGFPDRTSRLFTEALRFNVTLLTFSHLQFMLDTGVADVDLSPVWGLGADVASEREDLHGDASEYWAELDTRFCDALDIELPRWVEARTRYFEDMTLAADREIERLQRDIERVREMEKEQLAELAIRALGLEGKMAVISAKKERTRRLLDALQQRES